jgi:hypothetical protein
MINDSRSTFGSGISNITPSPAKRQNQNLGIPIPNKLEEVIKEFRN